MTTTFPSEDICITNQQVYDAIEHCIEQRWKPRASSTEAPVPSCALCVLFETKSGYEDYCISCPINLLGQNCNDTVSPSIFMQWVNARNSQDVQAALTAAGDMIIVLEACRAKFLPADFAPDEPWNPSINPVTEDTDD